MEGVPRIPVITFPLRKSGDTSNFKKLAKYISSNYGESPDAYSKEIYDLEALRSSASHPTKDLSGCALLKKYYCQLNFLKARFPLHEGSPVAITFTWHDSFSEQVHGWADIDYELSTILYNIGALHCELAGADSRTTADDMKNCVTHYQCAAWAFLHMKDNYVKYFTPDISPDIIKIMSSICLTQAQECVLEKTFLDNRKSAITAKVVVQIVEYYQTISKSLEQIYADVHNVHYHENVEKAHKKWKKLVDIKILYYRALGYFYRGQNSEDNQKYGESIAFYRRAKLQLENCFVLTKNYDKKSIIHETIQFTQEVIIGKLTSAEKDNEFIYHDRVPDFEKLDQEIKGVPLVKPIPFRFDDPEISGQDIFSRLVPMEAHEASSLYSEAKAELLRNYSAKIEEKNQILDKFVSAMQLEHLSIFDESEMGSIPQVLVDCCAALNAEPNAVKNLSELMTTLSNMYHDIDEKLLELKELFQIEETKITEYNKIIGKKDAPNNVLSELKKELEKYENTHNLAAKSNLALHESLQQHIKNMNLLMKPLDELIKHIPTAAEIGQKDEDAIAEMKRLAGKVNEMRNQRENFLSQLRDSLHSDDITKQIVVTEEQNLESFFAEQMKKHEKYIQVLDQNLVAQDNIIRALTETNARYADTRQAALQVIRNRNQMIQSLVYSFDIYDELVRKVQEGIEFYKTFDGTVSKLLAKVRSTFKVQEEEREAKMGGMIKTASATAGGTHGYNYNIPVSVPNSGVTGGPKLKDYLMSRKQGSTAAPVSTYYTPDSAACSYLPPSSAPAGSVNPSPYIPGATGTPYFPSSISATGNTYLPPINGSSSSYPASNPEIQNQIREPSILSYPTAPFVSNQSQGYQQPATSFSTTSRGIQNHSQQPTSLISNSSAIQHPTQQPGSYFATSSAMTNQSQSYSAASSAPHNQPIYNPTAQMHSYYPTSTSGASPMSSNASAFSGPYSSQPFINPVSSAFNQQPNIQSNQYTPPQQPSQFSAQSNQYATSPPPPQVPAQSYQYATSQPSSQVPAQSNYYSNQPAQNQGVSGSTTHPIPTSTYASSGSTQAQGTYNPNTTGYSSYYPTTTASNVPVISWPWASGPSTSVPGPLTTQAFTNPAFSSTSYQAHSHQQYAPIPQQSNPQYPQQIAPQPQPQQYVQPSQPQQYVPNQQQQYTVPGNQQPVPSNNSIIQPPGPKTNIDLLSEVDLSAPVASIPTLNPTVVHPSQPDQEQINELKSESPSTEAPGISPTIESNESVLTDKGDIGSMVQPITAGASKSSVTKPDPFSDPNVLSRFIHEVDKLVHTVEGFEKKCLNQFKNLDLKWGELIEIQNSISVKNSISVARCYPMKNRYPDILPYDQTRVPLPCTKDEYINATFMNKLSANGMPLIVTQAPLPTTYTDFWHMIWQYSVELIVCLATDADLKDQIYWPEVKGTDSIFGPFRISLQTRNVKQYYIERIVSVYHVETKQTRIVIQLQFTEWTANVFPITPAPFLSFINEVHSFYVQQRNLSRPVVVHCLSGVGKSGIFSVLSTAILELNAGNGTIIDLVVTGGTASGKRKGVMIDKEYFRYTYHCLLYYCQDLLMKRGILSTRLTFDEKPKKSHTRHPSQDFLDDPFKKLVVSIKNPNTPTHSGSANSSDDSELSATTTPAPESKESSVSASPVHTYSIPKFITDLPLSLTNLDPSTFLPKEKSSSIRETFENSKGALLERKSILELNAADDPLDSLDPLWTIKRNN